MSSDKNDLLHVLIFVAIFVIYVLASRNNITGINFQLILFSILIIYLAIIKRLGIIKDSFSMKSYERKPVIIGTILFIIISIILSLRGENIALMFSFETLFQTFTEELVFRVFLLGTLIKKIDLTKDKTLPLYFPEKNRGYLCVVLISAFFALSHMDSSFLRHFIFSLLYSLSFVLTNKKIYAPWLMHFINNLYAL